MINRKVSEGLNEFVGTVVSAEKEESKIENVGSQYHLKMKPATIEVKGDSGYFHEWIRLSGSASEESIPEGSVLDRYLQQMEIVEESVKKAKTLKEAFACLINNKYKFKRMKLGKSFTDDEGKTHAARESWVPVSKM